MAPRWPQYGLKIAQYDLKIAQDGLKIAQDGPKMTLKWPPNGPIMKCGEPRA